MKRIVLLTLALLAVIVVAACAPAPTPVPTAVPPTTAPTAAPTQPAAKVELRMMWYNDGSEGDVMRALLVDIAVTRQCVAVRAL